MLGGDIFWNNFETRVQAISLWTKIWFFFSFCRFLSKALWKSSATIGEFWENTLNTSLISMLKGFEKIVKSIQNVFSPVGLICYESKLWSESYPPSVDGVVFNVLSLKKSFITHFSEKFFITHDRSTDQKQEGIEQTEGGGLFNLDNFYRILSNSC